MAPDCPGAHAASNAIAALVESLQATAFGQFIGCGKAFALDGERTLRCDPLETQPPPLHAEVRIVAEDVATALMGVQADVVVTNPPYIPTDQVLPIDVAFFEPHVALFGGKDGLEVPRIFIDAAARLLKPGGLFVIEHGEGQAGAIRQKLSENFIEIKNHEDLNHRPRWSSAQRRPA